MKRLLLAFLITLPGFAALPTDSTTTWEVQVSSGNDLNAGCFITGSSGTDNTYPTSSPVLYTDLVAATTTTITSVATPFDTTSPGRCLIIASGSGWTVGTYYIVSQSSGTATVDRAIATMGSTGGTGRLGGAKQTLASLTGNLIDNNRGFIKGEATVTTASSITIDTGSGYASPGIYPSVVGYTTTRGDNGFVTVQATANGISNILVLSGVGATFANFSVDCNAKTGSTGIVLNVQNTSLIHTKISGCDTAGIQSANIKHFIRDFYITGMTAGTPLWLNSQSAIVDSGTIDTNTVSGTPATSVRMLSGSLENVIVSNQTGTNSDCITLDAGQDGAVLIKNVSVYNCPRDGFRLASGVDFEYPIVVENSIFSTTGGCGINSVTVIPAYSRMFGYNGFFSNTGGALCNVTSFGGDTTLTANPFTSSSVFTLNSTAGGGAAAKGVGFPGVLQFGGTGGMSLGAMQQSGVGGGSARSFGFAQ